MASTEERLGVYPLDAPLAKLIPRKGVNGAGFKALRRRGRLHTQDGSARRLANLAALTNVTNFIVLTTNFKGQHGKVKLQGMRRNTDPLVQHAVCDATMMQS